MMLTWLPDVLRNAGLTVVERAGWETRGSDRIDPQGVIGHHTATGRAWSDEAVARLLEKGRADLPGPLAQLGLRRSGVYEVIAAGRCNHNGYGTWGNDSVGIEAYNSGLGETWPAVQLDAFDRGIAAILRHLNLGADRYLGHRESDPGRKIDPAGIDLDAQRVRITTLLTPPPQEDILPALSDDEQRELLDRLRSLTPFPKDRFTREGVRVPAGTAGSVVGDPTVRWTAEAVVTLRDISQRVAALEVAMTDHRDTGN